MKVQIYATLVGLAGPIVIALAMLSCKSEQAKTNEETLNELLAEVDRGEWVDAKKQQEKLDEMPSIEEIAKGVEKPVLDLLMSRHGFRYDVVELKVRHLYGDYYDGYLKTNEVSLHYNTYNFWFQSNGAYYFITSCDHIYDDYPDPYDIDDPFDMDDQPDIDDPLDMLEDLPFFKKDDGE